MLPAVAVLGAGRLRKGGKDGRAQRSGGRERRGRRPFRVHVNAAASEGADVADPIVDRLRAELLR